MSDTDRAGSIETGGSLAPCAVCGHGNAADATVCAACGNEELGAVSDGPDPLVAKVKLFRVLVVFSTVCYLLGIAYDFAFPMEVPPDALEALARQGHRWTPPFPPLLEWGKVALYGVAAVSLLRFSRPGRLVYTLLLALSTAQLSLTGFSYTTGGIVTLLWVWMNMADGAILLMMWTTPLKHRFVRL